MCPGTIRPGRAGPMPARPRLAGWSKHSFCESTLLFQKSIYSWNNMNYCYIRRVVAGANKAGKNHEPHTKECAASLLMQPLQLVCRAAANSVSNAHAARFEPALLNESDFKDLHFHGQVRRFAHDTSDRLRPLPCLFFGPPLSRQRQLLPRFPLRQGLRLA